MSTFRKMLGTLLVLGITGSLAGFGVFAAFSSETSNTGNTFAAGTVSIDDNDGGNQSLYNLNNQKPGTTTSNCIKVTYGGSLDSEVRLFTPTAASAMNSNINVVITAGTQATSTFPSCAGFTASSGVPVYSGTLASFQASHNAYSNGFQANPGNAADWSSGESLVYRFDVSVQDTDQAQGATATAHTFTWRSENS